MRAGIQVPVLATATRAHGVQSRSRRCSTARLRWNLRLPAILLATWRPAWIGAKDSMIPRGQRPRRTSVGSGDRFSEVFSTDWSFGGGQDECRFGDGADSLRAQSDAAQRLPAGLERGDPAFSLSPQTAEEQVAGEVVRVQVAALGGGQHAGTGAVVALVGQRGQAQ